MEDLGLAQTLCGRHFSQLLVAQGAIFRMLVVHADHFSRADCTIHSMHITLHGSSVCMRTSFHLHVIHDERLIVRSLLLPRSVFLRVSLRRLPLLFHTPLAL